MNIETELAKGIFVVGECTECKRTVWPPADYCNVCFGDVLIKKGPGHGKIIEFSKQDGNYFCLAEFDENIRIIGKVTNGNPTINQKVLVKKCGIKNGSYYFEFGLI